MNTLSFTHFTIDSPLPGEGYGTGGFTLADFDGDGDLDMSIQRRSDITLYWYAYENDSTWIRHVAAKHGGGQLGAASLDVNRDGHPDIVMGRAWIENPGNLAEKPDASWTVHLYAGGMEGENHDIVAADIDQDGTIDLVSYAQNQGILRWYQLNDPDQWSYVNIAENVNDIHIHAGFAPGGVGDFNGDGYPDVLMPFYWYENPGRSKRSNWEKHPWPYLEIPKTPYGRSFRSWIADLDGDGDNDFVYADCDVTMSKAYWCENEGNAGDFIRHQLPTPDDLSGSYHSLGVYDLDLDEDLDIFIGEQEDANQQPEPGMKPAGLEERGMILLNTGTPQQPAFELMIIHIGNPGWHDTLVGDVDGDGDLDLVTKIWNADEGRVWHADYWRNEVR
ncbi:MAG: VCBS repeat-containing protein [Saprospiraceae bacterium]|nr:VCBS repeat-containing protein [Lewinella sp.]